MRRDQRVFSEPSEEQSWTQDFFPRGLWVSAPCTDLPSFKAGRLDLQGEAFLGAACWDLGPLKLRAVWPRAPGAELCVSLQRVQFGMYALYSKNKPRSDALMTSYGHSFFKVGQPESAGGRGMAGVS